MPNLSIAIYSDFCDRGGEARRWCHLAAQTGFTHLHWGHEFASEKPHTDVELAEIGRWLREEGLGVVDIHASAGGRFQWTSTDDALRLPALDLVRDALRMHAAWGASGAVVAHPAYLDARQLADDACRRETEARYDTMRRSLDTLLPEFEQAGCILALENLPYDNGELLERALSEYPTAALGYCFDCGHANLKPPADGFRLAERHADRMAAVHLHDNDSVKDLHMPPRFDNGNVDWPRVLRIIRASAYKDILSFEFSMRSTHFRQPGTPDYNLPEETIRQFLQEAHVHCQRLAEEYAALD